MRVKVVVHTAVFRVVLTTHLLVVTHQLLEVRQIALRNPLLLSSVEILMKHQQHSMRLLLVERKT